MATDLILTAHTEGITTLTLNRPEKRNALNGKMVEALLAALKKIAKDKITRVLMLNGNGENFCAGGDIQWMVEISESSRAKNVADAQKLADFMYQLYSYPLPVIALAHGAVLGGGLGLLSACDIVIAETNTSFGFSEVKIGITPSIVSPYVVRAIGDRAAHFYFLTGSRFDAAEAKRIGLVHQITETGGRLNTGNMIARTMLSNSPNALRASKKLIRDIVDEKINTKLVKKTALHLATIRATPEAQEGLQAFVEKRPPRWK